MKVVAFECAGRRSYGLLDCVQVLDAGSLLKQRYTDLRAVIAAEGFGDLRDAAQGSVPVFRLADVALLLVVDNPTKIICVGLNYVSHRNETRRADGQYPSLFTRFADTQIGHGARLLRPGFSTNFDYEGELALIIGRGGRHIAEENVSDHIAGYACYDDATVRDWQRYTHQWMPGKNFPSTGAFGPALVTPDEIPDLSAAVLTTRLNGQVMQQASIGDLIFSIPVIVSYISKFTPLYPGDVIATGTPGGVGDRREPPVYMTDGDVIEVEIDHVGKLSNDVATDPTPSH